MKSFVFGTLFLFTSLAQARIEQYNPERGTRSCYDIFVAYDYPLYNQIKDVVSQDGARLQTFSYEAYLKIIETGTISNDLLEQHLPEVLLEPAIHAMDNYWPAKDFLIQIYKEMYDPKNAEESLADIKEYYDYFEAYEITGERLLRFAQRVQYDVEEGYRMLSEDDPMVYTFQTMN